MQGKNNKGFFIWRPWFSISFLVTPAGENIKCSVKMAIYYHIGTITAEMMIQKLKRRPRVV